MGDGMQGLAPVELMPSDDVPFCVVVLIVLIVVVLVDDIVYG
jgi:hypothetical protein